MNMQTLYDRMKDALNMFGVSFSDMEHVEVLAHKGHLVFRHDGVVVAVKIPKCADAPTPAEEATQ